MLNPVLDANELSDNNDLSTLNSAEITFLSGCRQLINNRLNTERIVKNFIFPVELDVVKVYSTPMAGVMLLWEKLIKFWVQTLLSDLSLAIPDSLNPEGVVPVIFLNWLERYAELL
jgi:hypothetical protein